MAKELTFSKRYGYEPLPEPMRLEYLADDLRREIWNKLRIILVEYRKSHELVAAYYFENNMERFIERVLGQFSNRSEDEINTMYEYVIKAFKDIILGEKFNKVIDFVELAVNSDEESVLEIAESFAGRIKSLFEEHESAYQLDTSEKPYQIVPRASKEAGEAVQQAVKTVQEGGMDGASTHLRDAVEHINDDKYAASIAASIHAVESVARKIAPKAHTLGQALKPLEESGLLKNKVLKEALKKLYGYTNDEEGIRHSLIEKDAPDVGLDEALFMYGACASFAAYLTNKHRQMQEQEGA